MRDKDRTPRPTRTPQKRTPQSHARTPKPEGRTRPPQRETRPPQRDARPPQRDARPPTRDAQPPRPASRTPQKRAFTQASIPAAITLWGHMGTAKDLERALDVADVPEERLRDYTHAFHGYSARMHPLTARRSLKLLEVGKGSRVLDPFCGSGTILVEGLRAGAAVVGVDASPLALLIAHAKTWPAKPARRRELLSRARRIAALAVDEGKAARRANYEAPPQRPLPPGVSAKEREEQLKGWFEPHIRRELELLAALTAAEPDEEIRGVLLAVLSSILQKLSRRESDTRGEKVVRKLGRGMAARLYADRTEELVQGLDALGAAIPAGTPPAEVRAGDARHLDAAGIAPGSVTHVVTSPPYAGTFDYVGAHALRLAFLGLPQAGFAALEIGARRSFAGDARKVRAALNKWDEDLGAVLAQIAIALVPGGRAVVLIGDSLAGQAQQAVAVHADDVLGSLAPVTGLDVIAAASQDRQLVTAGERIAFALRPKREHLVLLERRA